MYRAFFNLRERPFDLTPNPRFLYLTGRHREALSNLHYGILGRKGITLLIGEAGTGKTTLVRAAIEGMANRQVRCVYLSNPALTRAEFYELLAGRFGLTNAAGGSKAKFLTELEEAILARHRAGGIVALVIDEAQSLPSDLMEEVRLLANMETETEKLLPVVLAGQPELSARLELEEMRQLKQRVALRCELNTLDLRETASYISGRIAIAGGEGARIFTREAVQAIHEASRGIPRTISVICDNALVTAFAAGAKPVTLAIVNEVCRDFRLAPISKEEPADGNGISLRSTGAGAPPVPLRETPLPPARQSGGVVVSGGAGVPNSGVGQASSPVGSSVGQASSGAEAAAVAGNSGAAAKAASPVGGGNGKLTTPVFVTPAASGAEAGVAAAKAPVEPKPSLLPPPPVREASAAEEQHLFGMFTKKKRFRFF